MAAESRIRAAFRRLEAQRTEIERQIFADIELSLLAERVAVVEMITSHPVTHVMGSFDPTATTTSINCHVTTTWFEA